MSILNVFTEYPKNIEISTPNYLDVWLFWCEKWLLFSETKMATFQIYNKKHGTKNLVTSERKS